MNNASNKDYRESLMKVNGLRDLVNTYHDGSTDAKKLLLMEFALHGLAEYSQISKGNLTSGLQFKDLLSSMFSGSSSFTDDDDEDYNDENQGGSRRKF